MVKVKKVSKKEENSACSKLKNYAALKSFYDLPEECSTLNAVLHKMSEYLDLYLKIIQQVLQPEEFYSLHEGNAFTDVEKAKLMELYTRIMIVYREVLKAEIINEQASYISTIQLVHEEVLALKPSLLDIVSKLQESWKNTPKPDNNRESARYFG